LVAGEAAARNRRANHEAEELGLGGAIDAGLGTPLSVVLLVGAVVLEKGRAPLADVVRAVGQIRQDLAAEVVALCLEFLGGA